MTFVIRNTQSGLYYNPTFGPCGVAWPHDARGFKDKADAEAVVALKAFPKCWEVILLTTPV